jgi:hypothetical protein
MFRTVTVVLQLMAEFNGAVSEEGKIVAITKIILNLMKQNDHTCSEEQYESYLRVVP